MLLLAGLSLAVALLVQARPGRADPVLLFVLGWRWLDRPVRLGAAIAIGTLIKVQPALLGVWALLTGRLAGRRRRRSSCRGRGRGRRRCRSSASAPGPTTSRSLRPGRATRSRRRTTSRRAPIAVPGGRRGRDRGDRPVADDRGRTLVAVVVAARGLHRRGVASWSRSSPASSSRRCCGTTTRCCCSLPGRRGCSCTRRWWAVADPARRPRLAAARRSPRRRLPDRVRRRAARAVHATARATACRAAAADRGARPPRRPERRRTAVRPGRHRWTWSPSSFGVVYWLSTASFDAGRGDFFYLADAFLHGRTWLDFAPGPNDVISVGGRFYVPFAPFPAIAADAARRVHRAR